MRKVWVDAAFVTWLLLAAIFDPPRTPWGSAARIGSLVIWAYWLGRDWVRAQVDPKAHASKAWI